MPKQFEKGKRYRFGVKGSLVYEATFDGSEFEPEMYRWKDVVMYSYPSTTPPSMATEIIQQPYVSCRKSMCPRPPVTDGYCQLHERELKNES